MRWYALLSLLAVTGWLEAMMTSSSCARPHTDIVMHEFAPVNL